MSVKRIYSRIVERSNRKNDCLIFTLNSPRIKFEGKLFDIHKIVWENFHPDIPIATGSIAHLSCRNINCAEVKHLRYEPKSQTNKESIRKRLLAGSVKDGDCIISKVEPDRYGYGQFGIAGKIYRLHRVVFWIASDYENIEDLPDTRETGILVRHKCLKKLCVNSDHYELGTYKDNAKDKKRDKTHLSGNNHYSSTITKDIAQAIADSWKPKGSENFKTQQERGSMFGVAKSIVSCIDNRYTWQDIIHPNGIEKPKPRQRRKKVLLEDDLDDVFWDGLFTRLKEVSIPNEEDNQFLGSPCWLWMARIKSLPKLSYKGLQNLATIWAAQWNSKRLAKKNEVGRHLCGNSNCVNPEHLQLGTIKENMEDKRLHGTFGWKLKEKDILEIRNSNLSTRELATKYNISIGHVQAIKRNIYWKHLG